ncbi:MAG: restriction endonuclease subunit S [Cyanobacteria bacterium P01_A01_bin.17]
MSDLVTTKATAVSWQVGLENIESWSGEFVETESEFAGEGIEFTPDDILFGKLRPYLAKVYLAERSGEAVGDFFVIRPQKVFASYLHKYILSPSAIDTLSSSTIGAKMPRVSWEEMGSLPVALPALVEQGQIARFLDHETTRIDALIAEQERLIELLKEKRQAVISHAVTKGLDPTAPMKDSGVEWLGEVPAHWELAKVKHVIESFEQGWSPQCENVPVESDKEWGILKVGCVNGGIFSSEENKRLPAELDPIPELFLMAGDVLISRANTRELVGSAALADSDYPNLMLSDKLFRLRATEKVLPKYLVLYLGTIAVRHQIELEATGASSSMLNIGQAVIKELYIPVPSVSEQQEIVAYLNYELENYFELESQALTTIDLLQERRSALISAAVTGKIDVRNWQAPSPAEALAR